MKSGWYVLTCRGGSEFTAEADLVADGFQVWVPKITVFMKPDKKRKPVETDVPAFGGYLFVAVNDRWNDIKAQKRITGFVGGVDRMPVECDKRVIDRLTAIYEAGYYNDRKEVDRLKPGDILDIIFGAMKDRQMTLTVVKGNDVSGVMDLLGANVSLTLSIDHIKPHR